MLKFESPFHFLFLCPIKINIYSAFCNVFHVKNGSQTLSTIYVVCRLREKAFLVVDGHVLDLYYSSFSCHLISVSPLKFGRVISI